MRNPTATSSPPTDSAPEIVRPQSPPQEKFLRCPADIAIYGGAAGGGKTWSLLMEPLRYVHVPEFRFVIFRRTNPQIMAEGGLWDEAENWYRKADATPKYTLKEWIWPSGAKGQFAHLEREGDRHNYDGAQFAFIGFDQLEQFTEKQFWYLLSRNRSISEVSPYLRATANPVPPDHEVGGWLAKLISWWWDEETGYPIEERAGVIRWFYRHDEEIRWFDSKSEAVDEIRERGMNTDEVIPRSFTFIPAKVQDNPVLMENDPTYVANLHALGRLERERLLHGNWLIRPSAGEFFNRSWFDVVGAVPADADRVRYWDKAGSEEEGSSYTCGVLMARHEGTYYVEHVVRGRWRAQKREEVIRQTAIRDAELYGNVERRGRREAKLQIRDPGVQKIWVEQEPGSGGKESAENTIRNLAGFPVDAERPTGDKFTRAEPLQAQAEAGNVKVVDGERAWDGSTPEEFIRELHGASPEAAVLDQMDAASGAFNKLAAHQKVSIRWGRR